MRYSAVIVPAALLLVAVSAAAATQAAPQPPTPGTRIPSQPPVASAPSVPDTIAYPATLVSEAGVPARQQKEGADEDNDVALAGITAGVLVPLVFFTFLGGVIYLAHRHKTAVLKARQETTAKIVDGLLAREDLASYLETPAGRRLLESASQFGETEKGTSATRVVEAVRIGVILLVVGVGLGLSGGQSNKGLRLIQTAITFSGIGFLLASGATYFLSKRLGLLQTPDTRD